MRIIYPDFRLDYKVATHPLCRHHPTPDATEAGTAVGVDGNPGLSKQAAGRRGAWETEHDGGASGADAKRTGDSSSHGSREDRAEISTTAGRSDARLSKRQ